MNGQRNTPCTLGSGSAANLQTMFSHQADNATQIALAGRHCLYR